MTNNLRCYNILRRYYHNFKKNTKKLIIIQLIIIILFSINSLSGCTENNYRNNDEYESIYLSYNEVNNSLNLAIDWLISNIKENGFSNYIYDYNNDKYLDENNIIHQLKNSYLITELSHNNDIIKEIHKTNLEYIIENYYIENNNQGYIEFENKSELGFNSITLRILLLSPFSDDYAENSNKLAQTILSMQNDDGSFQNDFLFMDNNTTNIIDGHEAILGLIEMYISRDNITYLNQSILSQNYFIKNYLNKINKSYYPILIPGHTKSLIKLYNLTNNESYIFVIKSMNNKILQYQEIENIDIIGHFQNLMINYNYSNSYIDGFMTESLTYTYEFLKNNKSINVTKYKIGLILGTYNLISLQYNEIDEKINGAIKFSNNNDLIRIDSTQKTIDAFLKIIEVSDKENNWNYSYYPELNLLVNNIPESRLSNIEVWYSLFYGTIISIAFIFFIYLIIKKIK